MNCKLKNKNVVAVAIAFAVMVTMSNVGYAENATAPAENAAAAPSADVADDLFGLDSEESQEAPLDTPDAPPVDISQNDELPLVDGVANAAPLNVDTMQPEEKPAEQNDAPAAPAATPQQNQSQPEPVIEAPKSPFESFGNAILSKVDNDLFNQMSNIEKQTTLLNLELKREEVKSRIEALRIQRQKAHEEEEARKRAEEEKAKEAELQRQIKLAEAEEKVRQKEIELEKIRQAKVLNDYMNEMLIINQQWVEKNAALQLQIRKLEDERLTLVKNFEDKMGSIHRSASSSTEKANNAKSNHERAITSLNAQISALKNSLSNSQKELEEAKNNNSINPFAAEGNIDENAIDLSQDYAIMDITGKGNNIVAKIVSKDGTTFIVHKGSMLKGGEVVTAITDNYVAFDNKGIKSYLYTGGTVMNYEPTVSFNDAGKTSQETSGVTTSSVASHNVRGGANVSSGSGTASKVNTATPSASQSGNSRKSSSSRSRSRKSGGSGIGSFSQGMFVH